MQVSHEPKTLMEIEYFFGLFFMAQLFRQHQDQNLGTVSLFEAFHRGEFYAASELLGGFPLCLSVSPGAASQGPGSLTLLCTSGEPKLAIFGISILVLVSNLKNCGVLINFICMITKKQLTNKIQPLEYKKILLLLMLCGLKGGETIRPPGGM